MKFKTMVPGGTWSILTLWHDGKHVDTKNFLFDTGNTESQRMID